MGRGVVTQQFDNEATHAIAGHVDGEQAPVPQREPAVQIDQCDEYQYVPNQFVEERRLHNQGRLTRRRDTVSECGSMYPDGSRR